MKQVKQLNSEKVFPYVAYIPDQLSVHPALIIQLHGAGERGNGYAELDEVLIYGFPTIVDDNNLTDCILVTPQCPPDSFWVAKIESIRRFVDILSEEYSIDKDRIYLCGMSMGGFGTWYTAMAYPDLFAAIAPCCGGGMAWNADVLKMPIWTFHGLNDTIVSCNQTLEMVNALKDKHHDFQYDLYEGVGHNSWEKAFSQELLGWLLSKHK